MNWYKTANIAQLFEGAKGTYPIGNITYPVTITEKAKINVQGRMIEIWSAIEHETNRTIYIYTPENFKTEGQQDIKAPEAEPKQENLIYPPGVKPK
jgi:hypothetical protein